MFLLHYMFLKDNEYFLTVAFIECFTETEKW